MKKIRWGMIGGGIGAFIGDVHRIAARITDQYQLIGGVFDVDGARGKEFAVQNGINPERSYPDIDAFIKAEKSLPEDSRIQAVTIVTPNNLHYAMAKKLIMAGFHCICEKPVTTHSSEAIDLQKLIREHKTVFCITHAYTGYPMVRQMKQMIADGAIGSIQRVDAQYYQGWINPFIHDPEKRKSVWRLNPEMAGTSCCIGDIGSHAFNLIEYVTGMTVDRILSDLNTLYPDNPLDIDGTVMLRLKNKACGLVRASQIACGEENNLQIQVYGDKGGFRWEQENPNYLHHFLEGKPAQIFKTANAYNYRIAQNAAKMPPGHPEGLYEAFANLYRGAADAMLGHHNSDSDYPGIDDGVRSMRFIEASVESSKKGNIWISL